jgi:hypothetical protein
MSKIIGIVGSRRRDGNEDYKAVLDAFLSIYEPGDWICSGGCPKGGDRFAERLHRNYSTPYLVFPANWSKYGKRAGFVRNKDIAKFSDVLIACVAIDRQGGTEHTIREFQKMHNDRKVILV